MPFVFGAPHPPRLSVWLRAWTQGAFRHISSHPQPPWRVFGLFFSEGELFTEFVGNVGRTNLMVCSSHILSTNNGQLKTYSFGLVPYPKNLWWLTGCDAAGGTKQEFSVCIIFFPEICSNCFFKSVALVINFDLRLPILMDYFYNYLIGHFLFHFKAREIGRNKKGKFIK